MMEFSTNPTKYAIHFTSTMKKDFKRAYKRNYNLNEFAYVVERLANGEPLDEKYRDHELTGN